MAQTQMSVLLVHHTTSPNLELLREAMDSALKYEGLEEVSVTMVPALGATVSHVLAADAYVILTPANFGYMSGAVKHFFDTVYYPCGQATARRPYGMVVHGNNDTTGAVSSIGRIAEGLGWVLAAAPAEIIGEVDTAACDAAGEVAATVAAQLVV